MTLPCSLQDKQQASYIECDNGSVAIQAKLCDSVDIIADIECAKTFLVVEVSNPIASTIISHALPDNTRKFLIKHRDKGIIEMSHALAFTDFFTIPAGANYNEEGLCTESVTIFFRSSKTGTIEIIQWS